MRYLLDTCVISELIAKRPSLTVVQWVDSIADESAFLSAITIGEIQRGVTKLPNSRRKQDLTVWLENELLARFRDRILALDADTMLAWGRLAAGLEQQGRTLPAMDSLIAATALNHNLHLATRNEKDFVDTGVALINPWH